MSLPASDNFNRDDENPLAGNWTTVTGQNALRLVNNRVAGTVSGKSSAAYWNADAFNDDHWSQATISLSNANGHDGPICRAQDDANTFYLFGVKSDVGYGRYYKCVAGTVTQIGSNAGAVVQSDVLKLQVVGDQLTGSINGVAQTAQTDTAIPSGGSAGLREYQTDGRLDDWSGDNVATGNRRRRLLLGSCA